MKEILVTAEGQCQDLVALNFRLSRFFLRFVPNRKTHYYSETTIMCSRQV